MTNEEILKLLEEAETEIPRNAIPKICKVLRHVSGVKHLSSDVEDERSDVESPIDPPLETPMGPADPDGFEAT